MWINVLLMLLGIILFAIGTGLYAAASLGRGSYEALTFSLAEKNGWQVRVVRSLLDAMMVIIGVLLGGTFGICTIVTILLSGTIKEVKETYVLVEVDSNVAIRVDKNMVMKDPSDLAAQAK